jgi:hypothetical protein
MSAGIEGTAIDLSREGLGECCSRKGKLADSLLPAARAMASSRLGWLSTSMDESIRLARRMILAEGIAQRKAVRS